MVFLFAGLLSGANAAVVPHEHEAAAALQPPRDRAAHMASSQPSRSSATVLSPHPQLHAPLELVLSYLLCQTSICEGGTHCEQLPLAASSSCAAPAKRVELSAGTDMRRLDGFLSPSIFPSATSAADAAITALLADRLGPVVQEQAQPLLAALAASTAAASTVGNPPRSSTSSLSAADAQYTRAEARASSVSSSRRGATPAAPILHLTERSAVAQALAMEQGGDRRQQPKVDIVVARCDEEVSTPARIPRRARNHTCTTPRAAAAHSRSDLMILLTDSPLAPLRRASLAPHRWHSLSHVAADLAVASEARCSLPP